MLNVSVTDDLVATGATLSLYPSGQIALEALDFVVDPVRHRRSGHPDYDGKSMIDML